MSNTFNLSRFGLLLRRQWIANHKVYLVGTAILFGSICLFYMLNIVIDSFVKKGSHHVTASNAYHYFRFSSLHFRETILGATGLLYICLLSGNYYSNLAKPITAIQELTLPVSATERLLCALVSCTLVTLLTFGLVFVVADAAIVSVIKSIYSDITFENDWTARWPASAGFGDKGFNYILQALDGESLATLPVLGFLLSSIFTLGSVHFRRFSFVKTSGSVVAFVFALFSAQQVLDNLLQKGKVNVSEFEGDGSAVGMILLVLLGLVGVFWAATYFKLKEKEV